MENRFDELTKALAGGVSRREALRRLGGGLAGVLLASMGLGKAWSQSGSVDCGSYCRARFAPGRVALRTCVHSCEDCQAGGGIVCGASSAGGGAVTCCSGGTASTCCSGACVNTASDPNNCGGCAGAGGSVCSSSQSCVSGSCCPADRICNGTCCASGQVCQGGQCVGCCPGDSGPFSVTDDPPGAVTPCAYFGLSSPCMLCGHNSSLGFCTYPPGSACPAQQCL
jgi:hypothetical protein